MVLFTILHILGTVTMAYLFLCMLRIALTWFGPAGTGMSRMLAAIVDPYLGLFARLRRLRGDRVDMTPVVALAVLWLVSSLLVTVGISGRFAWSMLIVTALVAVWSIVSFLLIMYAALVAARLLAFVAKWNSLNPAWKIVDALINPVVLRIKRTLYRNRIVHYHFGLLSTFIILVAWWIVLKVAFDTLINLAGSLPL